MTDRHVTDRPVTDHPVRSDSIDISPVADGYVVYDTSADLVHYLNHTAAMVLEMCTGRDTIGEISAFLADVFESVPDIEKSVTNCVEQLRRLGLVQPSPAQISAQAAVAAIPAQPSPSAGKPDRATAGS